MRSEEFLLEGAGPEWMDRAQCASELEAFAAGTTAEKIVICGRCPVLDSGERSNVWGGRDFATHPAEIHCSCGQCPR